MNRDTKIIIYGQVDSSKYPHNYGTHIMIGGDVGAYSCNFFFKINSNGDKVQAVYAAMHDPDTVRASDWVQI